MLKNFKYEALIIAVLFLNIFISQNLDLGFFKYFSYFDNAFQQIYLKEFFENITILGDSLWYFIFTFFFMAVFFLLKKNKFIIKNLPVFNSFKYYNFLLFLSVLSSGIFTQLLKHIIGRPRPNVLDLKSDYDLNFFTTDSHFHSFPSGHTSTIFAVALVLSLMIPRLKYLFFLVAAIVALSRVIVGAHFFTDIVGGIALAFIGFKFSKLILNKFFITGGNNSLNFFNNAYILIIIGISILSIILAVGPSIDIFISNLFYYGNNQFLIQSYYFITIFFRKIVLGFVLIYLLFFPFFSILFSYNPLFLGYNFKIHNVFYIWFSLFFTLIFIVNIILKDLWGRARPNEILELGGKNYFTPWYNISDQCSSNCSFVSGDASVGFSLILLYFLIKKEVYLWAALILGSLIGLVRIMEGGHFFSDVVNSGLIVFLLNAMIYSYYKKRFNV